MAVFVTFLRFIWPCCIWPGNHSSWPQHFWKAWIHERTRELRVCSDYLRPRTSDLELHSRIFPRFEAALFSTICARSDCTFIRLGNILYGKGLNICKLAKLYRCWLIITSFWGSWHVEQTATLPVSGKPRLRTAGWLRTDFSGLRTDSRTTVRAAFLYDRNVLRIFKAWFHDISCTHDSWIYRTSVLELHVSSRPHPALFVVVPHLSKT